MSDAEDVRAYTVRLELVDRPGELLRALEPIASQGGNLLSIFHERGNVTPRGHIPVEIDIEATPGQFEAVVDALQQTDVNVIQAGQERYGEEFVVVLVGDLVSADLSGMLERFQTDAGISVRDFSVRGPDRDASSARLRLAAESGTVPAALDHLRELATDRNLRLVEPLTPGGGA
jgi:ACT domain-containing protein